MRTAPFNIIPWKVTKEQASITSKELNKGKLIKSKPHADVGYHCLSKSNQAPWKVCVGLF
jgi:hypothetical protein